MYRLIVTGFAAVIGLNAMVGSAADLTPDESTELRQRADEWQRMRAQNPNAGQEGMRFDRPQGDVKPHRPHGDVKPHRPRGEVKAKPKAKKSKAKRAKEKIKRKARALPGALVRQR